MVPPVSKFWVDLWHVLPETRTELEELMQEEETHNLPETSKDCWRHSTPRSPEVVVFPRCNNASIEWYERMPADPPLTDPKGKKLLSHLREKMPLQRQMTLWQMISLHIEMGRNLHWDKSNTACQSDSISSKSAWKEREILYHIDYTDKPLQCCYPNARQISYQISGKPSYAASW